MMTSSNHFPEKKKVDFILLYGWVIFHYICMYVCMYVCMNVFITFSLSIYLLKVTWTGSIVWFFVVVIVVVFIKKILLGYIHYTGGIHSENFN
jgi:hypothetical protein